MCWGLQMNWEYNRIKMFEIGIAAGNKWSEMESLLLKYYINNGVMKMLKKTQETPELLIDVGKQRNTCQIEGIQSVYEHVNI